MPQIIVTERQKALFDFIQSLDKEKKNVVKIFFRGREPWDVEEISRTKLMKDGATI